MKTIIPYEHDIKFASKIAEITSISLEHEDKINETEITGDFIVSGDYKVHSISVNKEPFKYRLPFSIELNDNLIRDSIKYDISDFTYDIKEPDTLTVKIEVLLEGEEVEEPTKEPTPTESGDFIINSENNVVRETPIEENIKLNQEMDSLITNEPDQVNGKESKPEPMESANEKVILNNAITTENTYISYHVHVVSETDTYESICKQYNINKDLILEYNENKELKIGDKILIPEIKDE